MGNNIKRIFLIFLMIVIATSSFSSYASELNPVPEITENNESMDISSNELLGEQFIKIDIPVTELEESGKQPKSREIQEREIIQITLHVWWSENDVPNGLGRKCPQYGVIGQRYWLNYEIYQEGHWNYETLTGTLLDEEHNFNYTVTETIFYPNGNLQMQHSYNNDNNWISLIPNNNIYTGIYKGVVTVSGDLNITVDVSLDMCSLVTYSNKYGSNTPSGQIKSHGNPLFLSDTVPTRNGYTFTGWAASTGEVYDPGTSYHVDNKNVTLTATWNPAETLLLDSPQTTNFNFKNKEIWYNYIPKESGNYTFTSFAAPNFDPDLYVYDSAFSTIGRSASTGNINDTFQLTSGEKYYFKLYLYGSAYPTGSFNIVLSKEKSRHIVTYNYSENGGTSATKQTDTVIEGEQIDLTPTAAKSGYKFIGWNTDKNATSKLDSLLMGSSDITLYAIFKNSSITISYDANGGSNAPKKQLKQKNEDLKLSTEKPKRSGYYFLGWATNPIATVADYLAGDVFTNDDDTTLYAVWETTEDHYDTVLVLDVSGSMDHDIPLLKNAADVFCELILTKNPNNRISIVLFGSNIHKLDFSSDLSQLSSYIESMSANGSTNMAPAVEEARQLLKMGAHNNFAKNVIFMADGEPNNSSAVKNEYALLGNSINTFSLGFHVSGSAQKLMKSLQNAGYWDVADGTGLTEIFEKINNDIQSNILNKDIIAEDGTEIILEESVYKCDVGETIYVSGTFSSPTIACDSSTVTWQTNDPSAVVFGSMSVLGPQNNSIFSIPVTGNKAGVYTIIVKTANGASSCRRIEVGTINKNLKINAKNHFLIYSNKGFQTQNFNLDISILNNAGMLIASNFTENQLQKFTSGNIDVLITLPEGLSFEQNKDVREKHFFTDKIEPNQSFNIDKMVYLYHMPTQKTEKEIEISVVEYEEKKAKSTVLTGKAKVLISETANYQIDSLPPESNELPQELKKDLSYEGDLKISEGIHLIISKSLTVHGSIIVEKGGCLEITAKGKLYADSLVIKKKGTVTTYADSANIGNITVKDGLLDIVCGLITSDYLNVKSGMVKIQSGKATANNLTIEGNGKFHQNGGKIIVSGDFRTSTNNVNTFIDGELWIGGNFKQTKNNDGFQASEKHNTIFYGGNTHTISMQRCLGFGKTASYFNNLYIDNAFELVGPDKIESIAQNEIYKVNADIKKCTYRKIQTLYTQDEFEKALIKALDTDVSIGLKPTNFNNITDKKTIDAIEGYLTTWLTEITSPFITMIVEDGLTDSNTYTHTLRLTLKDKTKLYFTTDVTNYGSYATFSTVYWSDDINNSKQHLLGMVTQSSISAFKTQVARYLAKESFYDMAETLGIIGIKYLSSEKQYRYAIDMFLDYYSEVKQMKDGMDSISDAKVVFDETDSHLPNSLSVDIGIQEDRDHITDNRSTESVIRKMFMPLNADMVSSHTSKQEIDLKSDGTIVFHDKNLETSIREALHLESDAAVTIQIAQTVKRLDLQRRFITRIDGLEYFTNLEVLYLSDNYISDLTPLSGLTNLKTLDLQNNNINNIVALSSLVKMQYLDISKNLIDNLPVEFKNLSELIYLDISENNITSLLAISNMVKMQYLDLSGNDVSSENLDNLHKLNALLELYAADCSLSQVAGITSNDMRVFDISDNNISNLPALDYSELQILKAGQNQLENLSQLKNGNKLKELYIPGNNITDAGFYGKLVLSSLCILDIQDNKMGSVWFVTNTPKLRTLYLNGNPLTDLSALWKASALKELHLSRCELNDTEIDTIELLTKLETLDVSFNRLTSLQFVMKLTKLKFLDIRGNFIIPETEILDTLNSYGTTVYTSDSTINVRSVEFFDHSIDLETGQQTSLKYFIYPLKAENKYVTWMSNNPNICTVDSNGKILAKSQGSTEITITTKDGKHSDSCIINVTTTIKQPVTKVKLNKKKLTLGEKEIFVLKATISPSNATNKKVIYKTSNKEIVTVSSSGKVKALKKGKVTITATADGKSAKCTITVKAAPQKITLNAKKKTLKKGRTFQLKAKLAKNAASYKITYKTSNKKVATVSSSGKIKAVKKGKATITATTFNKKKATIKIIVK